MRLCFQKDENGRDARGLPFVGGIGGAKSCLLGLPVALLLVPLPTASTWEVSLVDETLSAGSLRSLFSPVVWVSATGERPPLALGSMSSIGLGVALPPGRPLKGG